jgi:hypothetical protein
MQLAIEDLKEVLAVLENGDIYLQSRFSHYEYIEDILKYLIDREKFERAYIDIKRLNSFTTLKLNK